MAPNKLYDSSDGEDDAWELVGDEATPLALSENQNTAPSVPANFIGDVNVAAGHETHQETVDAPRVADSGGEVGSGDESSTSLVSSATGGGHIDSDGDVKQGEGDVGVNNVNTKVNREDGSSFGSESFATAFSSIMGEGTKVSDDEAQQAEKGANGEGNTNSSGLNEEHEELLAAYYDEERMRWVFPLDDPARVTVPTAPPMEAPAEPGAEASESPQLSSAAESTEKAEEETSEASMATVVSDKEPTEREAPKASVPVPRENVAEVAMGEDFGRSDLVDSLSGMGFEKGLIEKTIDELHCAGCTKIDHDSIINSMEAADSPKTDNGDLKSSDLVGSLINMGFKSDEIKKAIEILHREGAKAIDEDAVIEAMEHAKTDDGRPWDPFVEFSAQDFNRQNRLLRRRTQRVARNIGHSARELWSNVRDESQRFHTDLRARCDEVDIHERTARATTQVKYAASSARDSICRANEEYRITDKLATAAVVGGATLLALGNPRAGVGVIAAAGATLAAGEAMKKSSARSSSTYTRDYGLGEGFHID